MIALVTGASKGIGLCLCNMLINKGYKVIGIYNKTPINNQLIDSYKCDLKNEQEIINLFNYIKKKYHKLDILVNCAAQSLDNSVEDKTKEEFMEVLEVNLVAPFLLSKYAISLMEKGRIINIASTNGIDTYTPYSVDYDASKAGLINLTNNLGKVFKNIKVCAICPNWVDTETTLNINPLYLKEELERINQKKLIKKEDVCQKIIDIIESDSIKTGTIIRMDE